MLLNKAKPGHHMLSNKPKHLIRGYYYEFTNYNFNKTTSSANITLKLTPLARYWFRLKQPHMLLFSESIVGDSIVE